MIADIYKEKILDHYKNPRNWGRPKNFDISYRDLNEFCGDEIKVFVKIKKDKIEKMNYIAKGCVVSISSASMLSEYAKGKSINEILKLDRNIAKKFFGIELGPNRIKCALLPLKALKMALYKYKAGEKNGRKSVNRQSRRGKEKRKSNKRN